MGVLPGLTEVLVTAVDYTGPMNALPPPACGVVCDIDVQGHALIKQKARRTPLRHLGKLCELLKGLLKAGLVAFSASPWTSPIVIVLKKNGVVIRLCIDYKLVNAVAEVTEYAMPLVDDLLTDMESCLWFGSLDAVSEFWAIMMTERARKILQTVGHMKRDCPGKNGGGENDAVFAVGEERFAGWLIDGGASSHMTPHHDDLFDYEGTVTGIKVAITDGEKLQVVGRGTTVAVGGEACGTWSERGISAFLVCYLGEDQRGRVGQQGGQAWELWHARVGHPGENAMAKTQRATIGLPAVGVVSRLCAVDA
ncbi:hypothetical protein ON010_g9774 [Phytophthora cinnamomi]|nr:hypothetical protein ON010_g9774 [Phytophthora cinnamomi]